jgi:hypothetical protein
MYLLPALPGMHPEVDDSEKLPVYDRFLAGKCPKELPHRGLAGPGGSDISA